MPAVATARRTTGALLAALLLLTLAGAPAAPAVAEAEEPYACRQELYPYDERYPGVHAASLEQLGNGDLLYTFFGGSGEGSDDVAVWGSRLAVGSDDWTAPEVVFDTPDKPEGNTVVWDNGKGKTFLFLVTQQGDGWTEANLRYITSNNFGKTWTKPRYLRKQVGLMLGNGAERLSNGEALLPIYAETEDQTQWRVGFVISDDDFKTWEIFPRKYADWPKSPNGAIQADVVELEDGHLLAYLRTADDYIYATESHDYGRTWSTAEATTLPNPGARVALLKLDSGALVLAYNPSNTGQGRDTLRVALSDDDGKTWPQWFDVENSPGSEFSYPWLTQSRDGMVHLAYTHKRMSMRHVVFNEAYVREGADLASDVPLDTPFYPIVSRLLFQQGVTQANTCDYSPA